MSSSVHLVINKIDIPFLSTASGVINSQTFPAYGWLACTLEALFLFRMYVKQKLIYDARSVTYTQLYIYTFNFDTFNSEH